ncbi:hypothetical protein BDY21DRAFT_358651 [Lineolata rhizophorae]|uniref:Uncharacterized protein n=1 Tax=Lineolata rhizophorae TaxID=578093 RepID=A0A6A6NLS2_9PEZI|nr:hypothetical protein BDY21DRAFT_358651 [Lineolata rhizophorae]
MDYAERLAAGFGGWPRTRGAGNAIGGCAGGVGLLLVRLARTYEVCTRRELLRAKHVGLWWMFLPNRGLFGLVGILDWTDSIAPV